MEKDMFSLGVQFGLGLAAALIVVGTLQYIIQSIHSHYLAPRIKKLIKKKYENQH